MNVKTIKEEMKIAIVGHVDHGKSTIIGRLLADTNSLPEGKLEQVKETCRRNSKPFEYAFLLDALKDEQKQGITIDVARCFFKSKKRNYLILDSPGHVEFIKNMVTGAAQADAVLLVIDAHEGIKENSIRHGYILSLLGIKNVIVLINKMDLINYDEEKFYNIKEEFKMFLEKIGINPLKFIPVSGRIGDNITFNSENTKWYNEGTVLENLDNIASVPLPIEKDFRMPIQGVYKFTKNDDNRRIIAGTVLSGNLNPGDEVVFYPSGKKSKVLSIEGFSNKINLAEAGYATGITLEEQIYVKRGDIVTIEGQKKPYVSTRMGVKIFWMGKQPLYKNKEYIFKLGSEKTIAIIEDIEYAMDLYNMERRNKVESVEKYWVAECIIKTSKAVIFDLAEEFLSTGRFVLVDNYDIAGGGLILKSLSEEKYHLKEIMKNSNKWNNGYITKEDRENKLKQNSKSIILISSDKDKCNKLAMELEKKLFDEGNFVYFFDVENLKQGFNSNEIINENKNYLYQLVKVIHIMIDAGMILILTNCNISEDELIYLNKSLDKNMLSIGLDNIYINDHINIDLNLSNEINNEEILLKITSLLKG